MRVFWMVGLVVVLGGCNMTPERWGQLTETLTNAAVDSAVLAAQEEIDGLGLDPAAVAKLGSDLAAHGGRIAEKIAQGEDIDWLQQLLAAGGILAAGAGGLVVRRNLKSDQRKSTMEAEIAALKAMMPKAG